MLPQRTASAIVPSRNALRVLRHLALAGSTLGGICAVAALTYDTHRRASIAEKLVKNKRTIQTSTPYYNATSAAKKLALMVETAEAGEYDGLASLKEGGWNRAPTMRGENAHPKNRVSYTIAKSIPPKPEFEPEFDSPADKPPPRIARFRLDRHLDYSDTFTHRDLERAVNDLQRAATTKAWLADRSKAIGFSTYDQMTSETPIPLEQSPSDDLEAKEGTTRTIRDLFQRGRIVEAAELFLESRSENNESLSSSDLELVVNIFYANCADDNVWVARNLFEHIEAFGFISPRMWQALLIALAKANAVDSASQLILKYMERIDIPYYMSELVICCLIETHRFPEASAVFYKNLQTDRSCALSNVYLETLWKKTRNIEAVKRDLDKILSMLGRFRIAPTAKIFNPLLKAYIYFGRYSDAAALYNDMTTLYGVTPTCRSRGLLLLGDAFCCNWKEVKEGLQEMHELGMTSDQKSFVPAFTSLFLEYWPTHNAAEIREFFMEAVEKYLLQPDQYLFEHVLDAYIQKGNPEMVAELTRLAEKLQWKVSMNEDEFMGKIQINRRRVHNSPAGFWQLLNAARSLYGQAAASRQILGYDHQTLPWPEANCLPDAKSFPSWYRRALQSRMTAKPLDKYANLHLSMADAIRNGDFKSALSFYKNALQSCYEFATYHVELAAIAHLLNDGLVPAQELIRAQWGKLQEKLVILPQFFHQVTECDDSSLSGVECVKLAVFRFYGLCLEYPKLQLTHNLTNHVAMEYISQDRPDLALDLLITAYKSRWGRQLALDAACMRTMLRAFVLADHLKGVRWCILTAMARESACDKDFVAEARRALITGHLRRKKGNYGYKKRVELLDHLGRLVSLLERKHAGDPELAQLLTNKVHAKEARRRSGKTYFPKVGKWHDDAHGDIGKTVAYWDEERELEWVIEPPTSILLGKDKTMAMWNESRVVAEAEIAC